MQVAPCGDDGTEVPQMAVVIAAGTQRPYGSAVKRRVATTHSARGGIAGPVEIAALTTGPAPSKAVP